MKENKAIELVDLATEERLAWLEKEQQENDLKGGQLLGMSIFVGVFLWAMAMLIFSGCSVQEPEIVDPELQAMSDGISYKDRAALDWVVNHNR